MDFQESATWHARRQELFAKRDGSALLLDSLTISTIAEQLPSMEFYAAMSALQTYRNARPYKGFWWNTYLQHYAAAKTDSASNGAAALPASQMSELLEQKALEEQAYETQHFRSIPMEFRERCRTRYSDIGWPVDEHNRAWRMIVLAAYNGEDVERFRIHPSPFSAEAKQARYREELDRQTIIEGLRIELESMRKEVEYLRQGATVSR